jgi:hypothetical protein
VTVEARNEWLARFSAELARCMPVLSLVVIRRKGLDALERHSEMLPEDAARACAEIPPLRVRGDSEVLRIPREEIIWTRRFALHLRKVQGAIRGGNAMAAARKTYPDARDLAPDEAAEIYASSFPPRHVGEPGD